VIYFLYSKCKSFYTVYNVDFTPLFVLIGCSKKGLCYRHARWYFWLWCCWHCDVFIWQGEILVFSFTL